jgi:Zn-dependent peptidase ImmA (M78 family)
MPHDFIVNYVTEYVASITKSGASLSRDDLVSELAAEFDVSAEAMGYRLINLGILAA